MKLLASWLFSYIDLEAENIGARKEWITELINSHIAEVDAIKEVTVDVTQLYAGEVRLSSGGVAEVEIPETGRVVSVSIPEGAEIGEGETRLIVDLKGKFRFATHKDFGGDAEQVLPEIGIGEKEAKGSWRKAIPHSDLIISVDAKSISHRPDLWSHAYFALEVSADEKVAWKGPEFSSLEFSEFKSSGKVGDVFVEVTASQKEVPEYCALQIKRRGDWKTPLVVAYRLAALGNRLINPIVDLVNYLTLEIGQPMHVYDVEKVSGTLLRVESASGGEKIDLLAGKEIELNSGDLLISDAERPICLAGVSGGTSAAVEKLSDNFMFESAAFSPAKIRRTAARISVRTDASSRFGRGIAQAMASKGLERVVSLLQESGFEFEILGKAARIGKESPRNPLIEFSPEWMERFLGIKISADEVKAVLQRLRFSVTEQSEKLRVEAPFWRKPGDVSLREDVADEVVRVVGFEKVRREYPRVLRKPWDSRYLDAVQRIKTFLSDGSGFTEQYNYIFLDSDFMKEIGLPNVHGRVVVENPVASNRRELVPSLIPNLLFDVSVNSGESEQVRFFEVGRIWNVLADGKPTEEGRLAGVVFDRKGRVSYEEELSRVINMLEMAFQREELEIRDLEAKEPLPEWGSAHRTGRILAGGRFIGYVGMIRPIATVRIAGTKRAKAFFFELLVDELVEEIVARKQKYTEIIRHQSSTLDLSFVITGREKFGELRKRILNANPLVERIELVDVFRKKEWDEGKHSVTFRIWLSDPERSLSSGEIAAASSDIVAAAKEVGAELRSE